MRLVEALKRQMGCLIFILSNHVSLYMVQCNIFAKLFYTSMHFSRFFPGREMPLQHSQLFLIVGTLHIVLSHY